ncbi:helix-turn-helix domain-containing protein [Tumebacillus avium]|nr:tetratricopeptide repeat protein [Tumebacillus avium]
METLGQRIRGFRLKKGLTQIELARGFITPSMVSQIESDRARPSYKVLVEIASRLDVSLEQLMNGVNFDLEYTSKYKLAIGMVRAKEFGAAIPLLEGLLEAATPKVSKENLLMELARCQLELGNVEEAESKLNQVMDTDQGTTLLPLVLLYLGKVAQVKSEIPIALFHTKRALNEVQKAQAIEADLHVKILMQLALLLEKVGKAAEAAKYYEQALKLDHCSSEERAKTYLRLAEVYDRQKKYEQAEEYATKAAILLGEQSNQKMRQDLQHRSIMLRRGSGDWKESVQSLLSIAEKYEQNADSVVAGKMYADIAQICRENKAFDEALSYAEKARMSLLDTDPVMGKVHRVLADVFFHKHDDLKGQKHLDNAIKIYEQQGMTAELEEVMLASCRLLNNKGDFQEAYRKLEHYHQHLIQELGQRGIVL